MTDIENDRKENVSGKEHDTNSEAESIFEKSDVENEQSETNSQQQESKPPITSNPNISKYRQTGKMKHNKKHPYSHNDPNYIPFDVVKDNLINTIQSFSSHVDSNTLTQSIAPILSTVKFERPQFKPRQKSSPFPSQHDQGFELDEKFISALMPKELTTSNKDDLKAFETNSVPFVNNNVSQNDNKHNRDFNFENQDLTDLHLKIESLLENQSFLVVLQHLEKLQKDAEMDIERRREEIKNQHNQKRIDLYNLHRKRIEKQPERRNEVIARNNKEYKDLERLIRQEMSEFENKVSKEIDDATRDQQIILQNAGVPGFFPTTDSNQISLQSKILNLLTTAAKERMMPKKHIQQDVVMYPHLQMPPPPPQHYIMPQHPFIYPEYPHPPDRKSVV